MLTRLGPPLTVLLLAGPILAGLLGTILPAFGYLPALGGIGFSLDPFRALLAEPGIAMSALISLAAGLATTAVSLTRRAGFRRRLLPARGCSAASSI